MALQQALEQRDVSLSETDLLELARTVRRVVRARLGFQPAGEHDVEDVVQETLARVLEVSWRLDRGALTAYAVVTARNLMAAAARERDLRERHAPRLVETGGVDRPDELVLREEEYAAVQAALGRLPQAEADLLLAHTAQDAGTRRLAGSTGVTPAAVAARLARARARLRVEFLLALRRIELPTPRCLPVLLALSASDRRRQRALSAGTHLARCETCARLSEPLVARRRVLAGLLPGAALTGTAGTAGTGAEGAGDAPQRRRTRDAAAAAAVVALLGLLMLLAPLAGILGARAPAASPAPAAVPDLAGAAPAYSLSVTELRKRVGMTVAARDVLVLDVPADEGFWVDARVGPERLDSGPPVDAGSEERAWVQLRGDGESGLRVRPGQRLDLEGVVAAHSAGFARSIGVQPAEGAHRLDEQGQHLAVDAASLRPHRKAIG